jgi:hypothetical protein
MLVRTVECLQGEVPLELVCAPRFCYGRVPARWTASEEEPEFVLDATDGKTTMRLMSDMRMGIEGADAHARHTLREGERRFCALSWVPAPPGLGLGTRLTRTSREPRTSGVSGSPPAATPTTRGGPTYSARHWC